MIFLPISLKYILTRNIYTYIQKNIQKSQQPTARTAIIVNCIRV